MGIKAVTFYTKGDVDAKIIKEKSNIEMLGGKVIAAYKGQYDNEALILYTEGE